MHGGGLSKSKDMKHVAKYLVCAFALFVALVLLVGGGWWSLIGFIWCVWLYMWGERYPRIWREFWRSNMRILAYFDCL